MTKRTIGSVMDEINEWQGPNGTVFYVTAFTTNNEMISVGKKDMDAALEVRGLLQEVIEVPQEFILEPKGQTKKGNPKWNLKAFGPPEGVWTYSTIKGGSPEVNGGGSVSSGSENPSEGPTPHRGSIPRASTDVDASIRASVALKAAANAYAKDGLDVILGAAEKFDEWLAMKSGGTASVPDQGEGAGTGEGPAPSSTTEGKWQERVKDWPDPSDTES